MLARQGIIIRIFPRGHMREHRRDVVAISQSASSWSFSLTRKTRIWIYQLHALCALIYIQYSTVQSMVHEAIMVYFCISQ